MEVKKVEKGKWLTWREIRVYPKADGRDAQPIGKLGDLLPKLASAIICDGTIVAGEIHEWPQEYQVVEGPERVDWRGFAETLMGVEPPVLVPRALLRQVVAALSEKQLACKVEELLK